MGNGSKMEFKKGPWTREEDQKLLSYIQEHGHGSWRSLPAKAGLQRCGKSCRLRWTNYLRPDIKRGKFSTHEEKAIIRLHALLGNRWSAIATHLPKRTDNEIKNYWNTRLKKRLTRMGIDPTTHKPKNNNPAGGSAQSANLSHMAQWETARLEAEARLVRESKLLSNIHLLRRATNRPSPPQAPPPLPCLDVLKVWQATRKPNCFFGSTGVLESPTSTLNFSGNNLTSAQTIGAQCSSFKANNDVACVENFDSNGQAKGNMESSVELQHHENDYIYNDYDMIMGGSVDLTSMNHDSVGQLDNMDYNGIFGDFEEGNSYWNELLNVVSLPTESPVFYY